MTASAGIMEIFSSLQGEGLLVGERQLFVRFFGCNLSCAYCDTEASREPAGHCMVERTPGRGDFTERSNPIRPEELTEIIQVLNRPSDLHHSVALTGGEPLMHAPFLSEFLPLITQTLPVMLETNGTLHEALGKVLRWLTIISMDVKLASSTGQLTDWESHRLFLQAGAEKTLFVKTVLTPEVTEEELALVADLIVKIDPSIPLILQPRHGTEGRPSWNARLMEIQALLRENLRTVRVIPQVHKILRIK